MSTKVRKWMSLLALLALAIVPVLAFGGDADYTSLGTIADGAADTTNVSDCRRFNGAGFIMTWTGEDSMTVAIQSSIDGGTTWFTLRSVLIDGGTNGTAMNSGIRAIEATDAAATAGALAAGGGFANLPIGWKTRAIITPSGNSSATVVKFLYVFAN